MKCLVSITKENKALLCLIVSGTVLGLGMLLLLSELKVDNWCIPFSFQWEETVVEGSFKRRKKIGHVTLILETNILPFTALLRASS